MGFYIMFIFKLSVSMYVCYCKQPNSNWQQLIRSENRQQKAAKQTFLHSAPAGKNDDEKVHISN